MQKWIAMQGQVLREKCAEIVKRDGLVRCTKLIRLRADGAYLNLELVKKALDGGIREIKILAQLPRETYYVNEPYFGEHFVAYEGGKLVAVSRNWDSFLRKLRNLGNYVSYSSYLLDSQSLLPYVEKTVSAGLSDSGEVVDPFGALDTTDYGAEPLKAAYVWVRSMYAGRNATYAWFNVVALIAQVAASPLRDRYYLKNQYLDYVVYNVGVSGLNMGVYVLEPMLGGHRANHAYGIVIYRAPLSARRGSKRLAMRLLYMNRLPLVLAGQTKRTLEVYRHLLESASGGTVEVDRRRKEVIPNLRSLFVFAETLHGDAAARSLVLRWEPSQIRPPPLAGLPPVKPIYGFAARLWKKYRGRLATINKLPYLVGATAEAIAREIRGEAEEVATFTENATAEVINAFVH
jgi:hypothetical protein